MLPPHSGIGSQRVHSGLYHQRYLHVVEVHAYGAFVPALAFAPSRGGPDAALSVWVVEQQEVTEKAPAFQSLLFLRHPDIQSDVWATPPISSSP